MSVFGFVFLGYSELPRDYRLKEMEHSFFLASSDHPDYCYPGQTIRSKKCLPEMWLENKLKFDLQLPWKLNSTFSSFISIGFATTGC